MTALYIRADEHAAPEEQTELTARRASLDHWRHQASVTENGLAGQTITPAQARPVFAAYSASLDAVLSYERMLAGRA